MAFYATPQYWDERYQWSNDDDVLEETFDWYVPYAIRTSEGGFAEGIGLRDEMLAILPKKKEGTKILIVGCGISTMGEQLYDDGYHTIDCVDFSEVCIKRMQRREKLLEGKLDGETRAAPDGRPARRPQPGRTGLQYLHVACEDLPELLVCNSYDAVIDKGMIDATFCDADVSRQYERVTKIIVNVYDMLRPGAPFIHVTPNKETSGARGVIFRNPVLPWTSISVAKLEIGDSSTGGQKGNNTLSSVFYNKPYWLFHLVK